MAGVRRTFIVLAALGCASAAQSQPPSNPEPSSGTVPGAVISQYCITCHNERLKTAGLMLDRLEAGNVAGSPAQWEKVVRKLRSGAMPPAGLPRPDKATYNSLAAYLEGELDRAAAASPNPGRPVIRRLSRTEYTNSVRDLLGIDLAAIPLPGDGDNAPHERAGGAYLTGVHPTRDGQLGVSVDQIAAKELGKQTQLASLELGLHDTDVVGQCEKGWNCGYLHTLSWRTPTTPLPSENRPRAVFERLFGESNTTDPAERRARIQKDRSLLDSVSEAAARLLPKLGSGDRTRLAEYLESIRDVERRIRMAETQSTRELPVLSRPAGIPELFDEYAKLMFDLNALAFQCDLTRVTTFMMGREQSDRSFPEIGVPDAHHALTHSSEPAHQEKVLQINIFHSKLFAHFLEKLRATPDGDGSLLDHSMIVYGSGISEGRTHSYLNLPVLVVGGGAGHVQGSQHIQYPKDTPMTNLYLTLLDHLGIRVDQFGDSNGQLELLSVA
ncbi:MAG: DUF1552 domain-containing protein [Acidobacteria bacterium]|nr:DUF1552 domain-containing protein [Acidobacteriota bacterium]